MTSSELSEWMAYDKLDPVGEIRGDIRNAQLSSLIVNLFKARFGKKSAKTAKPIDFMPEWGKEENEQQKSYQSVDEMKSQIDVIAKAFGVNKKKDKNHKRPHELKREKKQKKKDKGDS